MLVALASATAIAILLPAGADEGCPSPRQVSDAVSAHLPGVVLPLGRAPGPSALRLSVTTDDAGTLRVDLSDPHGGALLRRRVAPETAARTKAAECVALAETAALIVDRYWHEVGYEVPPAPAPVVPKPPPPPPPAEPKPPVVPPAAVEPEPPAPEPRASAPDRETVERPPPEPAPERPRAPLRPPDWWLAAGISGAESDQGLLNGAASLAGAVERPAFGRRVGVQLSVSGRYPNFVAWPTLTPAGKATIVQVSAAMDVYLAFPVGLGRLEPGVGVDLNAIIVTSTQGTGSDSGVRWAPAVNALLAWMVPLGHDIFVRATAAGALAQPYEVFNDAVDRVIFKTPRWRAELGLQLGVSFY